MDQNMTLEKRIAAELYSYQGRMSVFVDDLRGSTVEIGADEEFETASTIKAFILAVLYLQASRGRADLEEEITYEASQFVDGSGMLRALGVGAKLKVKDTATMMIICSDNIATNMIIDYLEEHGARCHVQKITEKMEGPYHYTDPDGIPEDTQCIIVLGGDGTLLQAARDVVHLDIPLLGINLGTLGFLAEVDKNSVYPALDRLLTDDYELEERMMLEGKIYRGDELVGKDIALNDIVIGREGHLRVIRFKNYVNDSYMNSYNADGIIISTPTGSTGYSLSAGGPVVSPSASMMIMTPIAPHTMNTRSIILSGEEAVTVEIGEGRHNTIEKAVASFDGDTQISMVTGDRIVIRKATVRTKILKLNHLSFVEVLRQKMSNS